MPGSLKWQQHVTCTQIIRHHPDWTDEQVLVEAHMHPLEVNIVQEARREVQNEVGTSDVQAHRSY
jgi:hypothetical protein